MARKYLRFGFLLFLVALYPISVFYAQDLLLQFVWVSLALGAVVYRKLVESSQTKWIFPSGLALALILTTLHYATNVLFFPRSARAPHYLYDACLIGPMGALFGLLLGVLIKICNQSGNVPPKIMQ